MALKFLFSYENGIAVMYVDPCPDCSLGKKNSKMTEIALQAMLIRIPDGQGGTGNILPSHLFINSHFRAKIIKHLKHFAA